jgi:mRNA interferase MazF
MQVFTKRPALVLYDAGDQDVLVARITSQEYSTKADFKVKDWKKCGLLTESFVRLGKQATLEKQHIVKKLGTLEASDISEIKAIMIYIFLL